MATPVFDTLSAARQLEAAGIETKHAEAIVTAIRQSGESAVTKTGLEALRSDFKADLSSAVNRMLLAQVAIAGLLFTAIKFL